MKEKFIHFIVISGFILFLIFGAVLFIGNINIKASFSTPEDKVVTFGIGISIGGSVLLWFLLKLGKKIKSLNNFLEKPPIKKAIEYLLKIFIFIWIGIFLYWLLGILIGVRNFG